MLRRRRSRLRGPEEGRGVSMIWEVGGGVVVGGLVGWRGGATMSY